MGKRSPFWPIAFPSLFLFSFPTFPSVFVLKAFVPWFPESLLCCGSWVQLSGLHSSSSSQLSAKLSLWILSPDVTASFNIKIKELDPELYTQVPLKQVGQKHQPLNRGSLWESFLLVCSNSASLKLLSKWKVFGTARLYLTCVGDFLGLAFIRPQVPRFQEFCFSHVTQIEKTQPSTRNRKLKINTAGLGVAALMQNLCHSLILNPSWQSRIHKFNYSCAVWSYLSGKLSWLLVRNWGFSHFLLYPGQQVLHLIEYYPHHHQPRICQFLPPTHLTLTSYKWNLCVQLFGDTFSVDRQNWSCTGPSNQNSVDIFKRTHNYL